MNPTARRQDQIAAVAAGSFAGLCSTVLTNPFDTIKVRLSASREATGETHKSLICHLRKLFSNGIKRGFGDALYINLVCSVPSNAVYLSTYRNISPYFKERYGETSPFAPMMSAVCAVVATNSLLAPLFTARTRIQIDSTLTVRAVVAEIYARDGIRGFYRGAATNMAGRALEETIFWMLYEFCKYHTNQGAMQQGSMVSSFFAIVGLSAWCKMAGTFIAYPYNVLMTHLREVSKVTNKHEHTRILPTVRFIYAKDGVPGFYKGVVPQLCRSIPSKASQMVCFEAAMFMYYYTVHGVGHSVRQPA